MARIRSIKPDAFKSDTLSSVSVLARWTFAGLWTYCDDEGRGRADARLIKSELFPIDDGTTLAHVEGALDELEQVGAVCRYRVGSRMYLHIPEWGTHQKINRPSDSKFPGHTGCGAGLTDESLTAHGGLSESPLSPPDRKGTGNREQGKGGATHVARVSESFPHFWAAYPRHTDKARALKAWGKALHRHDPEMLTKAATKYARSKRGTPQQYILHPSTWLNGERWNDEDEPEVAEPKSDPTEQPPDGLSDEQYASWYADQRARA